MSSPHPGSHSSTKSKPKLWEMYERERERERERMNVVHRFRSFFFPQLSSAGQRGSLRGEQPVKKELDFTICL